MNYLVSVVINDAMYAKCIASNKYIDDACTKKIAFNNKKNNENISILYNKFLENLGEEDDGWLLFCHEDFEFLENPVPVLNQCELNAIYGVFGARIVKNLRGELLREYVGKIFCTEKYNGTRYIFGQSYKNKIIVDTLDCQCLMVHSQIMRKYGLRFDPNLRFNLYAEDLCLNAKLQHQLPSRVVHMRCCHHSLVVDMSRFPTYSHDFAVVSEKYANRGIFAGTCSIFNQNGKVNYSMMPLLQRDTDNSAAYRQPVDPRMMNHAAVRAASMMKKHGVILDVGCASGDIGRYFAEKLGATLYGFEYNQQSIEHAKSTKVYQDVLAVNLNDFDLTEYSQFYQYFDHIYCGDILEHVYDPWEVLKKLSNFLAKEGSLLVSVPNIAHCTVSANLLNNEFSYADCGILDKTHIRWFTWKSMAELFAEAGLRVIQSTATFRIPCEYDVRHMPKRILRLLPRIFEADKHALVLQYISELCPSPTSFEDLLKNNWEQLEQAPDNNAECLQGLGEILREFHESVRLSCERYPDELRATVRHYREKNDLVSALNETRLFSPKWYVEQYPEAVSANGDPLTHYLTVGWKKGYNPSMHFDTSWYLNRYPDAGKSSLCPLLHFIMLGMDKGYACNAFINNLPDTDT